MRFELMNQLVDYFFACMYCLLVQLESGKPLNSITIVWEAYRPHSLLELTLDCLSSVFEVSFRPKPLLVQIFAVREEIRTFLLCSTSSKFITTIFSIYAAGKVL